jgi:hypothetical protein
MLICYVGGNGLWALGMTAAGTRVSYRIDMEPQGWLGL